MAKKCKCAEGAPAWVVTYGDMMSLLLTFFIILVSMSELKQDDKFRQVMESLRLAFGYEGGIGRVPTEQIPKVSLIKKLLEINIPDEIKHVGSSPDQGIEGKKPRVTEVRKSWKISFGGQLRFERFSDQLLPGRGRILKEFAETVRGMTNLIEIVGHTTLEELPANSPFKNKDELAIARATRIRDLLVEHGLSSRRMRVVSASDHEPLASQAYTEDRLARNRRVEIVVTEALVNEYQGEELAIEEKLGQTESR